MLKFVGKFRNPNLEIPPTEGKNQALVGAIPFSGEYPGPRFEVNFDQPIKWIEFQTQA